MSDAASDGDGETDAEGLTDKQAVRLALRVTLNGPEGDAVSDAHAEGDALRPAETVAPLALNTADGERVSDTELVAEGEQSAESVADNEPAGVGDGDVESEGDGVGVALPEGELHVDGDVEALKDSVDATDMDALLVPD